MTEEEQLEREYARLLMKFGLTFNEVSQNLDGADFIERALYKVGSVNPPSDVGSSLLAGDERADVKEFIERIRAHPYLAGFSHGVLKALRHELETGIARQGLKLPFPVFVGEFPIHELNGCILKSTPGALILVNSGLVFLLHHIAQVVALMSVSNQPEGKEASTNSDRITKQVAAKLLANALITYFFLGLGVRPKIPMKLGPFQYLISGLVSQETTKFVLAHEFAHAIKGHLDTECGSWDQELEADATAVTILINQSIDSSLVNEGLEGVVKQVRYCAPLLFFTLDDLISDALKDDVIKMTYDVTTVVSANGNSPLDTFSARTHASGYTHPPGVTRREAVLNRLRTSVDEQALSLGQAFVSAIDHLRKDAIASVHQWCVEEIESLYNKAKNTPIAESTNS